MTITEYGTAKVVYPSPDNLVQLFEESVKKYANNPHIGEKNSADEYEFVTYKEMGERVNNLRGGLAQMGIKKGDAVGIIANNRHEWLIAEIAAQGLGAKWIPMYEKELLSMWKYVIKDSAIKLLIISKPEINDQIKPLIKEISTLEKTIVIDAEGEGSMKGLEELGKANPVDSIHPAATDVAVLIYTSGTTGEPKGVELTHGNLASNANAGVEMFKDIDENDVSLNILPWAHSFGISGELHAFTKVGASIGIMGSVKTLLGDIGKVRPTMLITVPRVFNKIYHGLWKKMETAGGLKLTLFKAAIAAAEAKLKTGKSGFKLKILDKLVFAKVRHAVGGRLKYAVTGSAKMDRKIAEFFFGVGIPVMDCYGLSETSPALTMNCPADYRIGSVGKAIFNTKIVIDKSRVEGGDKSKDGEIIAYGPQIMKGYHNKPDKTAEVLVEADGIKGVRTGDRGWLDDDGFLYITGRFKEEYKLTNGKYVHPASIENNIKLLPYIANAFIFGMAKEYNVCLIVPDYEGLDKKPSEILADKALLASWEKEILARLKLTFGKYEIPRKIKFLEEDFTLENGMLTQTMKLKRRIVLEKYQKDIDALYE
jgi:long-chain acyl-CoA synthetase